MNLAKSKTRKKKKTPEKIRREKCQWPPLVKSFLFDGCLIVSPLICLLLSSSTLKQLKVINKPLHYYQPDQYLRYLLDAILWSQLYLLKRKHKIIVNWNWQKKIVMRSSLINTGFHVTCWTYPKEWQWERPYLVVLPLMSGPKPSDSELSL